MVANRYYCEPNENLGKKKDEDACAKACFTRDRNFQMFSYKTRGSDCDSSGCVCKCTTQTNGHLCKDRKTKYKAEWTLYAMEGNI